MIIDEEEEEEEIDRSIGCNGCNGGSIGEMSFVVTGGCSSVLFENRRD